MSVVVRQATESDIPALFEFIKQAYGSLAPWKIPARWEWEFRGNPLWKGPGLPVWIAVDGLRIIGQTCAIPVTFRMGGRTCRAAWSVDTIVLPECQGKGIGTKLQKANAEANRTFMSLSMSTSNRGVKGKIGSLPMPAVTEYWRIIRPTPGFVKDYLLSRTQRHASARVLVQAACRLGGHYALSALAFPWTALRGAITRAGAKPSPGYRVEERHDFDERADGLWRLAAPEFDAIVERDRAYLEWKFVRQPGMRHRVLYLLSSGELKGYLVVRDPDPSELGVGVVAELFARPGDERTIRELAKLALRSFGREVGEIVIAASHPAFKKAIARYFHKGREVRPMFASSETGFDPSTAGAATWFLGKGDHDWDQVRPLERFIETGPAHSR